ncbi:MAG: CDP-glucose 4,6-dehydratase, partial [Chthoniobacterales bacterium]
VAGFARDPQPHERLYADAGLSPLLAHDVRGELADLGALTALMGDFQPEFVFHLAAQPLVRLSYDIPVETFATNVMGTVNVLEALRCYSASQLPSTCVAVMITTDKCYENREWLHAYREEDPMGGHDPYSASKGCAELVVASYRNSFFEGGDGEERIRVASARAGNVIGGGDWAADRIVPDCFRAIRAGGAIPVRNKIATRPWQHVLEPISGYLWLGAALDQSARLDYPDSSPYRSAFNFGPTLTSNRTVKELVEELLKHTGGNWEDRSDPNARQEACKLNLAVDKAFHLLGWQPTWNFETTIAETAAWYVREASGESPADLCDQQIRAYTVAAKDKGLAWAG